jgi:hypothetical protein
MSGNWLNNKTAGGVGDYLLGDISGVDGISSDGVVDFYDFSALSSVYGEGI